MKSFDELEHKMTNFLEQEDPSLSKTKALLSELTEFINDETEWAKLDSASKNTANEWQKTLKDRVKASSTKTSQKVEPKTGRSEQKKKKPDFMDVEDVYPSSHNSDAEVLMEQAEKAFYSGRYQEAIKYYDQVLRLEPDWERAKEHRAQADEYLTKGHIPETMLPSEVASLYGKAQSAARVMRLKDAMSMYENAKNILFKESGTTRWAEGTEFEKSLLSAIDAEEVAREAEGLFAQGRVDEAIEKVNMAIDLTGYPKYKNALERYQTFNKEIKGLHETLFSGIVSWEPLIEASRKLTAMSVQYRGNQALATLQTRFNTLKPILAEKIRQEVQEIKSRVESSASLEMSMSEIDKAKFLLDEAANNVVTNDQSFLLLNRDISRIKSELEKYRTNISKAHEEYRKNRMWPFDAWRISKDVRKYYPSDSEVMKLRSDLRSFEMLLTILKIGVVLVGLIGLIFFVNWASNRYKTYVISLTPTTTPTTTPLPTETPTSTPTLPPPTATPTPTVARTIRTVWVRNGCYESFTAIRRIPQNTTVQLLPSPSGERRFDNLNRECILVEARNDGETTIGWLLLEDLQP